MQDLVNRIFKLIDEELETWAEDAEIMSADEMTTAMRVIAQSMIRIRSAMDYGIHRHHTSRRMFYIVGDLMGVHPPEATPMSHREWADRDGWDYDLAIRGYADSQNIYAYRGSDWLLSPDDEDRFKNFLYDLAMEMDLPPETVAWNGVVPGIPGTVWPGQIKLGTLRDICS